jgi:hypothetical protein
MVLAKPYTGSLGKVGKGVNAHPAAPLSFRTEAHRGLYRSVFIAISARLLPLPALSIAEHSLP